MTIGGGPSRSNSEDDRRRPLRSSSNTGRQQLRIQTVSANSIMRLHPGTIARQSVFSPRVQVDYRTGRRSQRPLPLHNTLRGLRRVLHEEKPEPEERKARPGSSGDRFLVPVERKTPTPVPKLRVPALKLAVKSGSSRSSGAKVRITGNCSNDRRPRTRSSGLTSEANGPTRSSNRRTSRSGPALGHL